MVLRKMDYSGSGESREAAFPKTEPSGHLAIIEAKP
jgi:hypothetical protein